MLRQAWRRLVHKQWLIFYPLALTIISALAFLAVYTAAGGEFSWTALMSANFERGQFLQDHFFNGFALTPAVAVAVFAGLALCVFTAMLRAPLFRAIAGPGYPLAPRSWEETGRLSLFYVFFYLIVLVGPLAIPSGAFTSEAVLLAAQVIALLLVYAEYVIVFEGLQFIPAMRRSARLLSRRWPPALVLYALLLVAYLGVGRLYGLYYEGAEGVFLLVPFSQILVFSFLSLVSDLLFIYLYEQVRNTAV